MLVGCRLIRTEIWLMRLVSCLIGVGVVIAVVGSDETVLVVENAAAKMKWCTRSLSSFLVDDSNIISIHHTSPIDRKENWTHQFIL